MPEKKQKALLIIDAQKFFLDGRFKGRVSNHKKLIENLKIAINQFKIEGLPIIATRHFNQKSDEDPFFRFYKRVIDKSDKKSELLSFLSKDKSIKIFKKNCYSPFFNRKLLTFLKRNEIKVLYLSGVLLEKCILATAFDAFQRNFEVFVIKDCVGTRDIKNVALFFKLVEKSCGYLISLKELKECLN